MAYSHFVILSVLFAAAYAEIASFRHCDTVSAEQCTIHGVQITPCSLSKSKLSCTLKKGFNTTLTFDFTPNFAASKLKAVVYYPAMNGDLPFSDMESNDGCTYTTCPTVSGTPQTFNYELHIGKKLPTGSFQTKWKVWNEENDAEVCCFLTSIVLKK